MRIIVAEIETSIYSAIGSNLKFFGQEPITGVCHNVQCVYLLLVNLGIDELVVICPLIMCHVGFEALFEVNDKEGLQAIIVIREL